MNENEAKQKVKEILEYISRTEIGELQKNAEEILDEDWDFLKVEE